MTNALHVAHYLISLRDRDAENGSYSHLSNLKLQKLLYYCQGAHYKWDHEPLFQDERFETWEYGPTIRRIYNSFRQFGQNDISADPIRLSLTDTERDTIDAVWSQLKHLSPFLLVEQTQREAPWRIAKENGHLFLDDNAIKQSFQNT